MGVYGQKLSNVPSKKIRKKKKGKEGRKNERERKEEPGISP